MSVPLRQQFDVALYIIKQKLKGNKRYPLVLMLEPLFRCNLACAGCGKIDYPDEILNQRMSVEECLQAVDECGAPIVSIPGGEPLLHREIEQIVAGLIAKKKYVTLCTNALLLEKKMHLFTPSPYFNFSVHLDGDEKDHDRSVCQDGVYVKAEAAIRKALEAGFRVNINCTLFNNAVPERVANFFDRMMEIGLHDITVSPGYAYERAPDQQHFLTREATKNMFRDIFRMGKERVKQGKAKWRFSQSDLFMDYLAGNQSYECTPWGLPTRNIFGWQRPCYLLGEGYAKTYKELIETTEWEKYGTGRYEKCANCMVHCGYEPTAAEDSFNNPLKLLKLAFTGIKTEGAMAKDIDLSNQRPAEYVFSQHVQEALTKIHTQKVLKQAEEKSTAAAE
ncbi:MAG: adenosyl-hopene transferase HpnH [Alphaproteobacteria bacterium]|nr:adenosyl-hopene transferase HpnH [Alphaproteobacteria bacterium]MBV8549030.1 adenosyl-hopene transferase HpnH [Alphaproteobacteria bacterium]